MQHFLALESALKQAPFIFHIIPHESIEKLSISVKCHVCRTEQCKLPALPAYQHCKGRGDSFSEKHCKLTYIPKKYAKMKAKVKGSRNVEQGLHFLRLLSW